MKRLAQPKEALVEIFDYMKEFYEHNKHKDEGSIQLTITHNADTFRFQLNFDKNKMEYHAGHRGSARTTLHSSFHDWLKLISGRLNPIWGVISKRLRFGGDTAFFSRVSDSSARFYDPDTHQDPVTPFERAPQKHWKKPHKALVLNGSPRGRNGYTSLYLRPFLDGLNDAGVEIELITLSEKNLALCSGCWRCWLADTGTCVLNDEFNEINEKRAESDMLILAFPLYVDGMPALLKNFIDRGITLLYPYMINGPQKVRHPRRQPREQSLVMFSICGFPEEENFDAVRAHCEAISHNIHAPLIASVTRTEAMALANAPHYHDVLEEILAAMKDAGNELAETGRISPKTQKRYVQKRTGRDDFIRDSNEFWLRKITNKDRDY